MKVLHLFCGHVSICLILSACLTNNNENQKTINEPDLNEEFGSEGIINDSITNSIKLEICTYQYSQLKGYETGSIYQCNNLLIKVIPPTLLEDAPTLFFNNTGEIISKCGGMPHPNDLIVEDEICNSECLSDYCNDSI